MASEGSIRAASLRWLKFNAVGGMGIVVQLGMLALLKSGLGGDYLTATVLAVEAAVLHNFVWHERFTWADCVQVSLRESSLRFTKFNLLNGTVSIVGNVLLMKALVTGVGLNYMVANVVAIAACSILNFVVSNRLVFEGYWPPGPRPQSCRVKCD
jgi:putative flippase GtrA